LNRKYKKTTDIPYLVGGIPTRTYPSEKYEFVSWDDDIPNIWKNKSNVPNSQPVQISWFHGNVILHPIPLPDGWMTTE